MARTCTLTQVFDGQPKLLLVDGDRECVSKIKQIADSELIGYADQVVEDGYYLHIRYTFSNRDVLPYDFYLQFVEVNFD